MTLTISKFLPLSLFLLCTMAWKLWADLMNKFGLSWVVPPTVNSFMNSCIQGFWVRKETIALWHGATFAGVWCIWLASNHRIFYDWAMPIYELSERAPSWLSFGQKAHGHFPNISILELHRNWDAIIHRDWGIAFFCTCFASFCFSWNIPYLHYCNSSISSLP